MHGVPLRYSVRNLGRRPVRTVLTLLGLTLIVAIIVFLVAFGRSFAFALRVPGDPRTLIAISKKAQTFEFSSIPASELDRLRADLAGELEEDEFGEPLLSREVYHFVNVRLSADPEHRPRRSLLHGIDPDLVPALLGDFRLVQGRMPEPEERGILVGRAVADRLRADPSWLAVGTRLFVRDTEFTVVGHFEARGTLYENWILAHPDDLRVTLGRRDYSFARMRVRAGVDLATLAKRLSLDERYQLRVLPETEYFADFLEGFEQFRNFALLLALLLGLGGVVTGMNTMHNSVVGRVREIGVLRVLGFSKGRIFLAFLVESVLLTGAAGVAAAGIAWALHGLPLRVPVAASFPLRIDGVAVLVGLGTALFMGLLGMAVPMMRALRGRAVEAMRGV